MLTVTPVRSKPAEIAEVVAMLFDGQTHEFTLVTQRRGTMAALQAVLPGAHVEHGGRLAGVRPERRDDVVAILQDRFQRLREDDRVVILTESRRVDRHLVEVFAAHVRQHGKLLRIT